MPLELVFTTTVRGVVLPVGVPVMVTVTFASGVPAAVAVAGVTTVPIKLGAIGVRAKFAVL